jgi:hypothetical protein
MNPWPKHPVIYEINSWVWLTELSRKYSRSVTLSTVPPEEWDFLSSFGFDAIWFMGVWERSPAGSPDSKERTRRSLPPGRSGALPWGLFSPR